MGTVQFPVPPDQADELANLKLERRDDCLVSIMGGRPAFLSNDMPALRVASSGQLQMMAAETIAHWSERAATLLGHGDATSFFLMEMHTSIRCSLDAPVNVMLLGDVIRGMLPSLGRGASVAMRDSVMLGRTLKRAADGLGSLQSALASYDDAMLSYGLDVVRDAAFTRQ